MVWGSSAGSPLEDAFAAADDPGMEVAIILENDLFRRAGEDEVDRFLALCRHVVVIDHSETRTTDAADVVLPAATFAESTGTLVNNEPRAQRFYQVFLPAGDVRESRRWIEAIGKAQASLDEVGPKMSTRALPTWRHRCADSGAFPGVAGLPPAAFGRAAGIVPHEGMRVPRQSQRFSGRTAMHADQTVFEPRRRSMRRRPLAFSMEGFEEQPPPALMRRFWAPGWNSAQALRGSRRTSTNSSAAATRESDCIEPADVDMASHFLHVPPAFYSRREGALGRCPPSHLRLGRAERELAECGRVRSTQPYLGLSAGCGRGS